MEVHQEHQINPTDTTLRSSQSHTRAQRGVVCGRCRMPVALHSLVRLHCVALPGPVALHSLVRLHCVALPGPVALPSVALVPTPVRVTDTRLQSDGTSAARPRRVTL